MKLSILLLFLILSPLVVSSGIPPDFDDAFIYLHDPPAGLSAGWSGEDVYLRWQRTRDKHGLYVDGYRVYRASDKHSVFVQLETGEEHNLIPTADYLDTAESLENGGIVPSERFYYKVTAVVVGYELDEDGHPAGGTILFESHFSEPAGIRRGADLRCFISSAAYGTSAAGEVIILSSFRDKFLIPNGIGKRVVKTYEAISPPVARAAEKSSVMRFFLRLHISPVLLTFRALNF